MLPSWSTLDCQFIIKEYNSRIARWGISLVVQWLRLHTCTVGGEGSIPGLGTKIPQAMQVEKKDKNSQMEEIHRQVMGKRVWNFHAFSPKSSFKRKFDSKKTPTLRKKKDLK